MKQKWTIIIIATLVVCLLIATLVSIGRAKDAGQVPQGEADISIASTTKKACLRI